MALFVALFEKTKERLLFLLLFLKEQSLFWLLFWKEQKKSDRTFALLQRAPDCSIPLLKRMEISDEQMSKWAIAQPCRVEHLFILKMSNRSFFEQKMSDLENCKFFAHFSSFALFERVKERSLFSSLFLKQRKSDCSFCHSFWKSKRAIALSVALLKRAKKSNRSFDLLQRAPKRAIAHSLFLKERMCKRSLNCSFEKSGNEQWANERLPNPDLSLTPWWVCSKRMPWWRGVLYKCT